MTNNIFYPAIFHIAEEGGFWVSFPDIEGCFTQGDTMDEAYQMAGEAVYLAISEILQEDRELPIATSPEKLNVDNNEVVILVGFDLFNYKKKNNCKAVKKTLSIPEWLNELAVEANINFSQVLQEALIKKLL